VTLPSGDLSIAARQAARGFFVEKRSLHLDFGSVVYADAADL
jgi:hypothetical protein